MTLVCQTPLDMKSLIQRRGRLSRHGEESTCLTVISFTDFVFSYIKSRMAVFRNKENKHLTAEEHRKVSSKM